MPMIPKDQEKRLVSALWAAAADGLEVFRLETGSTDIPLHTYHLFLSMPRTGGINVSNLCKTLTLSQAAISRNLAILAGTTKMRKDGGFNLVAYEEDHQDRRYKIYRLSPHGIEVRARIEHKMLTTVSRMMHWNESEEPNETL